MKISFPKYGPGELLTRKRGATRIISFVAIAFFAGICGSYLLGNKFWLLTIALIGIAGILLCLGGAAGIFLNYSRVDRAANANNAPSANIRQYVPRITSQWDYRPRKPIRGRGVLDSPNAETSDDLSSDPFGMNDNVWLSDNSLEGAVPTFINGPPEVEEPRTRAFPQTTDTVSAAPTADDAAVRGTTKVL
jgi:hypothetical protein